MAVAGSSPAAQPPLATYAIGPGWATFGLALPRGAASQQVRVGTLATQTDVKTRWPDGSIRYAVVTALAERRGTHVLTEGDAPAAAIRTAASPRVAVAFTIGADVWTATAPQGPTDVWLSGPLVHEARAVVAPMTAGREHPSLRVVFDTRVYANSQHRIDIAIENTIDVESGDAVKYDVAIAVDDRSVFNRRNVAHSYLTRWRHTVSNASLSEIVPDVSSFVAARALPRFLDSVVRAPAAPEGARFEILGPGDLRNPMNEHGGRPEIAPYPDWAAQYLVHRTPDLRAYLLKHGDLAGSWPVHIRDAGGQLITIDHRPSFWLDCRAGAAGPRACKGGQFLPGTGSLRPDINHQPSLAYVPYLLTGDRYYLDEMIFWANYCLIGTYQEPGNLAITREGRRGMLDPNEVRGVGWALRNLADAAAYLPDQHALKPYFRQKVINNLEFYEKYANTFQTPLGTLFSGMRPEDRERPPYTYIALWEHTYLAWAIDHAIAQGFSPGAALRDRVVRFQLKLFTSEAEGYPRKYGAPYTLAVGTRNGSQYTYFQTLAEVFRTTYGDPPEKPGPFVGYYGPEARLMLMMAERLRMPRAGEALDYLMGYSDEHGHLVADLNKRAGWAVVRDSVPSS